MKFTQAERNENYPAMRLISESGVWELGIMRVLFGYRVCVNVVGDNGYRLVYCCGADLGVALGTLVLVQTSLEQFDERVFPSDVVSLFPVQTVKPLINDPQCWDRLAALSNSLTSTASGIGSD